MGQYNQQRKVAANGCLSNMKAKCRQSGGWTLPETVTVVAIIAVLVGLAIPSIRAINSSFQSTGAKNMISAALACARAAAAQHQRYAGVRFQHDIYGDQYIILILHDYDATGLANGFRAIEGRKPIRLPENRGVMDLQTVAVAPDPDAEIDEPADVNDVTTFSIIFSPSGKLVIHDVQVRNKDGYRDSYLATSNDDVFNKRAQVRDGTAMFYQDDYQDEGYDEEPSRSSFIIYDRNIFDSVALDRRWSDYLWKLQQEPVFINPYTGTIIE